MTKQFTLGKKERLKSRKQIEALFAHGRSFSMHPFRVFYSFSEAAPAISRFPLQVGVGVSHRLFPRAVDRNRVKRLIRESFRKHKTVLADQLLLRNSQGVFFFIFTGNELPEFQLINLKMKKAVYKLAGLINENNASNT